MRRLDTFIDVLLQTRRSPCHTFSFSLCFLPTILSCRIFSSVWQMDINFETDTSLVQGITESLQEINSKSFTVKREDS